MTDGSAACSSAPLFDDVSNSSPRGGLIDPTSRAWCRCRVGELPAAALNEVIRTMVLPAANRTIPIDYDDTVLGISAAAVAFMDAADDTTFMHPSPNGTS